MLKASSSTPHEHTYPQKTIFTPCQAFKKFQGFEAKDSNTYKNQKINGHETTMYK
jgi:hypothetical protein